MASEINVRIDGKPVKVPAGCSVAAAIVRSGREALRRSISGQPRGPLCAMGVCFECRVTIDGVANSRSCQTVCRDAMRIDTDWANAAGRGTPLDVRTAHEHDIQDSANQPRASATSGRREMFDVLVVGAGPAGIAAAWCAAGEGRSVSVVDDNPAAGGQIWRSDDPPSVTSKAAPWIQRAIDAGVSFLCGAQVVGLARPGVLLAEQDGDARQFGYRRLIIAAGARERFLPFPGWTLPGVMGVGGLQAMVKMGMPIEGRRVVIAGTGPLLLAVAAYLIKQRAEVPLVAEQASWASLVRFGGSLLTSHWGKLGEAVKLRRELRGARYRPGCWPIRAEGNPADGNGRVARVVLSNGRKTWVEPCDYLGCGFDLVPNLELPLLLGCATRGDGVQVDELQQTTVADVYCAGEVTGIGGVELSLVEGQIAGYAAAGNRQAAGALFAKRRRARRFARALSRAFRLRQQLERLAQDETIVCRCEDVTLHQLRQYDDWRSAKLHTRCGMGPCQGRICGAATELLLGWPAASVRPPILPARLATLADARTTTSDKTDRR